MSSRVHYAARFKNKSLIRLFIDFYTLNEIWFRTVGAETYGYNLTKVIPGKKADKIAAGLEKVVAVLKQEVIFALEASVRAEIAHWNNETSDKCYDVDKYTFRPEYTALCKLATVSRWHASIVKLQKLPLPAISRLFNYKHWSQSYGGKLWGDATDCLIKLKESTVLKDDIFLLDRIFDLQHNNGFILNKTEFAMLDRVRKFKLTAVDKNYVYKKALNFRFGATLADMVENSTFAVKKIYMANLNYIWPVNKK